MRLRPALAALSATALLGLAACGGSSDDLTTAEGQAAFEAVYTQIGTTAQSSEDAITAWTGANCGDEGASPTS